MSDLSTYIIRASVEHDVLADANDKPDRRGELRAFIESAEAAQTSDNVWRHIALEQRAIRLGLDGASCKA